MSQGLTLRRRPTPQPLTLGSLVVAASFAAGADARAEGMLLEAKEVTVVGIASISPGGEAAARDAAIRNAQRNAVEQVLGALIESRFSAQQAESYKNGASELRSQVEDQVITKSSGFIEHQEIIGETRDGSTYRVTLKAVVKAASLDEEIKKLAGILKAVNYPKLMLLLTERYSDKESKQRWIERPSIVPAVESELLRLSFDLVAKDQAEKLRTDGLEAFAQIVGDKSRVAEIASSYGADVAIIGSCEVKYTAYNELNDSMYYVAAVVNLQAVRASTAQVLASFEMVGKAAGASEELARVKAVNAAAPAVVSKLVGQLVQAWQTELSRGKRFNLVFVKVASYGKVARPLLKALAALPNVESVKEVSFGGGRLEVELIYRGKKDELLNGLYDDIASQKPFKKLDKVMDRGDSIELTL